MNQDEKWLLREKYQSVKDTSVFNESLGEIKTKYPWGEAFYADCQRLTGGEPLGYVIGHMPFLNCTIYLDSHPLIPRPETEYWVEKAIIAGHEATKTKPSSLRVLDLCAGSGCIGVAFAKAISSAEVDFAEIDANHHQTISHNLEANGIDQSNSQIFGSHLFEQIKPDGQYDFILSNPPYIDPTLDRTQSSVKEFEPHLALYGGRDGIELIREIIVAALYYLSTGGQLWIEHEPEQSKEIQKIAIQANLFATTYRDQYKIERYSILTSKNYKSMAK